MNINENILVYRGNIPPSNITVKWCKEDDNGNVIGDFYYNSISSSWDTDQSLVQLDNKKQNIQDENLKTSNKEIVSAINELYDKINDLSQKIIVLQNFINGITSQDKSISITPTEKSINIEANILGNKYV